VGGGGVPLCFAYGSRFERDSIANYGDFKMLAIKCTGSVVDVSELTITIMNLGKELIYGINQV
jgi:hypothetical protein